MQSGFLVLHGNRLEDLSSAVLSWLQQHPLPGLVPEAVLVQSNGMAEWFKMTAAQRLGVCAGMRVELPARFCWRAYRQVLGASMQVPTQLPLDKDPMVWRLMSWLSQPSLPAPLSSPAAWLRGEGAASTTASAGTAARLSTTDAALAAEAPFGQPALQRLAWCRRVADVMDQYQVYRPDWLDDWQAGRDVLRVAPESTADGQRSLPPEQAWQPALWRLLQSRLSPAERQVTRPALHREALRRLHDGPPGRTLDGLPSRLVLFGTTQLPLQTLELLAALARHMQVLLAVPNPCRFDWTDTSALPPAGHPLLSTWGRQSRDFIRQLERFDETQRHQNSFDIPRVDLFTEGPGIRLLSQVQAGIRDMASLAELRAEARPRPPASDRSIQFHAAHSALREVEVLHDQLLHQLSLPALEGCPTLQPRDIVVMVPDVELFAPAIRAVFGRHGRGDERHIPWGIADVNERAELPLLQTLDWLLQADQHRYTCSELQDLLELPALTARLGLSAEACAELSQWVQQAGLRWGLDAGQRQRVLADATASEASASGAASRAAALEASAAHAAVPEAAALHTWRWALDRLLLGYAAADPAGSWPRLWEGLEPVPGVGGLGAAQLGSLDTLLERLLAWWALSQQALTPAQWAEQARQLVADLFLPQGERERDALAALDDALARWLGQCAAAGFDEPVPMGVLRDAWLSQLQSPGLTQRFKAGGVTFCTLLPMRAVPFEMVCLLGMNDGEYPRSSSPSTLDLMQQPGLARAGDRSRRDDDRQLMLDAVLAARRTLYISWVGRNVRNNSPSEPSVLVSQLRDHLDAGWGEGVSAERTTEHPLQPFSRRCFEEADPDAPGVPLFTHAHEWRSLHLPPAQARPGLARPTRPEAIAAATSAANPVATGQTRSARPASAAEVERWSLLELIRFLRNPPRQWLAWRVGVRLDEPGDGLADDDEPFGLGPLEQHALLTDLVGHPSDTLGPAALQRLQHSGQLPWGGPGSLLAQGLASQAQTLRRRWEAVTAASPVPLPACELDVLQEPGGAGEPALHLIDAVDGLWSSGEAGAEPMRLDITASKLMAGRGKARKPRADKLLGGWVQALACAAVGQPVHWQWVAPDTTLSLAPPPDALPRLQGLLRACSQWRRSDVPPPALPGSAVCLLAQDIEGARLRFEGADTDGSAAAATRGPQPEAADPAVHRCFADFSALTSAPGHAQAVQALYAALAEDMKTHLTELSAASDSTAPADSPGAGAGDG